MQATLGRKGHVGDPRSNVEGVRNCLTGNHYALGHAFGIEEFHLRHNHVRAVNQRSADRSLYAVTGLEEAQSGALERERHIVTRRHSFLNQKDSVAEFAFCENEFNAARHSVIG